MTSYTIEQSPSHYYGEPLDFNPKTHRYRYGGKWVPGVTTILGRLNKPALIGWAANMAVDHIEATAPANTDGFHMVGPDTLAAARKAHAVKRDTAGDIGSNVHAYAEARLGGTALPPLETEEAKLGSKAFEDWLSENDVEPLALERRVFSKRHWYAGTFDMLGKINGRWAVLDFKTSSGIYPEFWLQTAAYCAALDEELLHLGQPVPELDRWLIHLNKSNGKFDAKWRPYDADDAETFFALCKIHQHLNVMDAADRASRKRAAA